MGTFVGPLLQEGLPQLGSRQAKQQMPKLLPNPQHRSHESNQYRLQVWNRSRKRACHHPFHHGQAPSVTSKELSCGSSQCRGAGRRSKGRSMVEPRFQVRRLHILSTRRSDLSSSARYNLRSSPNCNHWHSAASTWNSSFDLTTRLYSTRSASRCTAIQF